MGVVVVMTTAAAIVVPVYKAFAITDPYVIEPMTKSPAPEGSKAGHTINADARTLSVFSTNGVLVIADPGASFQYEVLWLVEKRRKDRSSNLMEYQFELPQYAVTEHINPIGSPIPSPIQKAADGHQWK